MKSSELAEKIWEVFLDQPHEEAVIIVSDLLDKWKKESKQ